MKEFFNEQTTVGELVAKYPQTRATLEKIGIDYCCGGKHDLKTAAAEKGVPLDKVLAALKDSLRKQPVEDTRDWTAATLTELANHIEERHHTFMREQLPRLQDLLEKVLKAHGPKHGAMLNPLQNTYSALRKEIEQHLMKEEQILFPYIRQIDEAASRGEPAPEMHCGSVQNPIRQMEHEHDNAGNALSRMRQLTDNYTLPRDACNTFRALYDGLQALEDDLHQHIHLENNILFPKAINLECAIE